MTAANEVHFATFGAQPDGTWSAPGRVNLVGEHTDYNGGLVLPFAIDRRTTCTARLTTGSTLRVASTHSTDVVSVELDALEPLALHGWSAYPLGVAWALHEIAIAAGVANAVTGCDIAIASDVPIGAGLSSSAAIECAVASALNELWGLELEPMEFDEDKPRISEGRINDGRRMYREGEDSGREARAPREGREVREPRERREYAPQRQAPRDPFFDQPYESTLPAEAKPAWESAKSATATARVSANIKPRKKVAALFKIVETKTTDTSDA